MHEGIAQNLINRWKKRERKSGLKETSGIVLSGNEMPSNQEVLLEIVPLPEASIKEFNKLPLQTQDYIISDLDNKEKKGETLSILENRFNYFLQNIHKMNEMTRPSDVSPKKYKKEGNVESEIRDIVPDTLDEELKEMEGGEKEALKPSKRLN